TDNQERVHVKVYNGHLDQDSLIGQFHLDGIAPAPRGKPKIEVTFDIDTSCVLTVTATNVATGRAQSVRITDTTLLSPGETDEMTRRHTEITERQQRAAQLADVRRQLADLISVSSRIDLNQLWVEFDRRRTTFQLPDRHI